MQIGSRRKRRLICGDEQDACTPWKRVLTLPGSSGGGEDAPGDLVTEQGSVPNPGSDEARAAGCSCAVMDNNRGKWKPWTGHWWITEGCPVHAPVRGDTDE
jgi:hypothetical protein